MSLTLILRLLTTMAIRRAEGRLSPLWVSKRPDSGFNAAGYDG